jgi:hypothetical protein
VEITVAFVLCVGAFLPWITVPQPLGAGSIAPNAWGSTMHFAATSVPAWFQVLASAILATALAVETTLGVRVPRWFLLAFTVIGLASASALAAKASDSAVPLEVGYWIATASHLLLVLRAYWLHLIGNR